MTMLSARYIAVYVYGGIYLDMDIEPQVGVAMRAHMRPRPSAVTAVTVCGWRPCANACVRLCAVG